MHFSGKTDLITALCLAARVVRALPHPAVTYSVVDVDGSDSSTPAIVPTTVYQTVTASDDVTSTAERTVSVTIIGETVLPIPTSSATRGIPPWHRLPPVISIVNASPSVVTETVVPPVPHTEASVITTSTSSGTTTTTTTSTAITSTAITSTAITSSATTSNAIISIATTSSVVTSSTTSTTSSRTSSEAAVTIYETLIETAPPSSTSYYDNGMWHTSYAIHSTPIITTSTSATPPLPPPPPSQSSPPYNTPPAINSAPQYLPPALGTGVYPTASSKRSEATPTGFDAGSWNGTRRG